LNTTATRKRIPAIESGFIKGATASKKERQHDADIISRSIKKTEVGRMATRTKGTLALMALATVAALLIPAVAQAQAVIKVSDTVNVKFGMQIQGWADWTQDAVSNGYMENLYIRRVRFLVAGQVAPDVTFFFMTDNPNLGKTPKALGTGFLTQDALLTWKIADAFRLEGGLFIVPLSRHGLSSTISYLTLDVSPAATVFAGPSGTSGLRDTGFQARGYLLDRGQLEYRVAVTQGIRSAAVTGVDGGSRNAFRTTTFLNYNFFETENGYVLGGTNLGKKKVLALAGGWDAQSSYNAYTANLFTTLPVGNGNEFAGQVLWGHYDGQKWIATLPQQNDYMAEVAYYADGAKVQPFAKYEVQKFSQTAAQVNDLKRWGAGFNYYVAKQNFKITAQYLRVIPDASTKPAVNEFTVQLQLFYF
jgi:Phosphate-selective porin O and P